MGHAADRISGAFFLLFGLAMYFLIIPRYVEFTDEGNIAPSTMPNYISMIIALCGAYLLVKPGQHQLPAARNLMMTGLYVLILAGGIFAMAIVGFEFVAPVLALAIMLLIGERRPLWLLAGVVAMPTVIWFLVVHILERALP